MKRSLSFYLVKLNIEFNSYFSNLVSVDLEHESVLRTSAGCGGQVHMAACVGLYIVDLPGHEDIVFFFFFFYS